MRKALALSLGTLWAAGVGSAASAQMLRPPAPDAFAQQSRLFVMTDVGNEPDDQMSFVRLLLYANEIELEGLAATTSWTLKTKTNPQTLHELVAAYGEVRPNLMKHGRGWPEAGALDRVVASGPTAFGLAAANPDAPSPAALALIRAADRADERPLWISIWGGANVLAEALQVVRKSRSVEETEAFVARLRVYSISDQDDAGPWIRREFPKLQYIVWPGNGVDDFVTATWTGISGDALYHNDEGSADLTKVAEPWLDANCRPPTCSWPAPTGHAPRPPSRTAADCRFPASGRPAALAPPTSSWRSRTTARRS